MNSLAKVATSEDIQPVITSSSIPLAGATKIQDDGTYRYIYVAGEEEKNNTGRFPTELQIKRESAPDGSSVNWRDLVTLC